MNKLFCIALLFLLCCAAAHAGQELEWFRGDLHMHSHYSDGDSPIADIIAVSRERGLDFISITDHDILMRGKTPHWNDPDHVSADMLLIYGVEWTTLKGHANIWAAEPFDYSGLWAAFFFGDADAARAEAHRQGALFSVCHPMHYGCCPWRYGFSEDIDAIEIWSGHHSRSFGNRATIRLLWDHLLRQDMRITAVSGSDTHYFQDRRAQRPGPGEPTTWVYAAERSAEGILDAVRTGAVTISASPYCERLELWAAGANKPAPMGSSLPAGTQVEFTAVRVVPDDGDHTRLEQPAGLLLIKNGGFFGFWTLGPGQSLLRFTDRTEPGDYYRAELWDLGPGPMRAPSTRHTLRAITNPLYFD